MYAATAIACFTALGHDARLRLFRHLVAIGPNGESPERLCRALSLPAANIACHLTQLERCGLLIAWRGAGGARFAANLLSLRMLTLFLAEDCGNGDPDLLGDPGTLTGMSPLGPPAAGHGRVFNVLFLCTGNSARSIIAEAVLNRLGEGRFRAFSAGSAPAGRIHPRALTLLNAMAYPTMGLRSKSWNEFRVDDAPEMDFVFTVCDSIAAEICPAWPGQPIVAHWGGPDPAAIEGADAAKAVAFAETLRIVHNRISLFVSLPMRALDKLCLNRRLDEIARTIAAPALA